MMPTCENCASFCPEEMRCEIKGFHVPNPKTKCRIGKFRPLWQGKPKRLVEVPVVRSVQVVEEEPSIVDIEPEQNKKALPGVKKIEVPKKAVEAKKAIIPKKKKSKKKKKKAATTPKKRTKKIPTVKKVKLPKK